jgi:predicted nucleic acid-binding protein
MSVYVDSSVLLRIVMGQPNPLTSWPTIEQPIASELIRVECLRRIDRARLASSLPDDEVAMRRAAVIDYLRRFALVPITSAVLERASQPYPTSLGSLDAIHLATATLLREQVEEDLRLATHDAELAIAARSMGFEVDGLAI